MNNETRQYKPRPGICKQQTHNELDTCKKATKLIRVKSLILINSGKFSIADGDMFSGSGINMSKLMCVHGNKTRIIGN